MNFEPQKFFVGLMDFFTILLPGALVTYLTRETIARHLLTQPTELTAGAQGWIAFAFGSYLFGHFVFLIGSLLDRLYDPLRRAVPMRVVETLADGGRLAPRWRRRLAMIAFPHERDDAYRCATAVRLAQLDPLHAARAINTYQWAKLRLATDGKEAYALVQRFEADSKFFRSLVIVLLIVPLIGGFDRLVALILLDLLLLPLAAWRYVEQRHKATNQAYWGVITLEGRATQQPAPIAPREPADLTHAGGVVYRMNGSRFEYLLVRSTDQREWVLPKGHIEPIESAKQAALREVYEETGVLAYVVDEIEPVFRFEAKDESVCVRYFLMQLAEENDPLESRLHEWRPIEDARDDIAHEQIIDALNAGDRMRVERAHRKPAPRPRHHVFTRAA